MKIIEAEHKEIVDLSDKTIDELIVETNTLYQQMEAIGVIGLQMMAQAGRRLNIIKERVGHGGWENWIKDNLKFSARKANQMMLFAVKCDDKNSVFSNPQTFADIGISKVWALLSAPEEVVKEVVADPTVQEKTVRELKEEIRKLTNKNRNLEEEIDAQNELGKQTQKELWTAEATIRDLKRELNEISPAEDTSELKNKISELEAAVASEKEKLKKVKDRAKSAAESAKAEIEKELEANYKEKLAAEIAETEKEKAALKDKLVNMEHKLKNAQDQSKVIFKVKTEQMQQDFLACVASINEVARENQEQADKMRMALKTIMTQLIDRSLA